MHVLWSLYPPKKNPTRLLQINIYKHCEKRKFTEDKTYKWTDFEGTYLSDIQADSAQKICYSKGVSTAWYSVIDKWKLFIHIYSC